MSHPTRKQTLAERQDPAALFLFDCDGLPARPDIVRDVERYAVTGARLLDNEPKTLRLVECLLNGWPIRKIARELEVSRPTIRAAKEVLVRTGKLDPYKQRVVKLYEEIVESGAVNYRDALDDGLVAPGQIPVGIGIIADKRALMLGEPTAIAAAAPDQSRRAELSVERLNAWVDALPAECETTVCLAAGTPDAAADAAARGEGGGMGTGAGARPPIQTDGKSDA